MLRAVSQSFPLQMEQLPSGDRESTGEGTAQSSRLPGRGGPRTAQRSELSFHCYSKHLLMRRVCVSGLGKQAGEQSWFRHVLEGALAMLSSHLCPAATAGSRSQVLCAEGWFWLETNPRPLLLPNHFIQQVLSHIQSSNKVLATALHGKISKCGSE